jgi:hypothetical protein
MRALTDTLLSPDGPLPLLILDRGPGRAGREPGQDADRFVSGLLSLGLAPVTATPPAGPSTIDLAEPLAPAPGCRLELSAPRAARLTAPDGSLLWAGECGQAPPWVDLITGTGRCAVLIGTIGLWSDHPPARMETMLNQSGDLVGALVTATAS